MKQNARMKLTLCSDSVGTPILPTPIVRDIPGNPIDICMPVCYYLTMKRTALFLKEDQLKKLLTLSDKTGAPVAELIRRAIDKYLQERAKELK